MAAELKPCPMCAGRARMRCGRICEDAEYALVECEGCGLRTDEFEDAYAPSDQARDAWNRRVAANL